MKTHRKISICVIENTPAHHMAYVSALRQTYREGAEVIPEMDKPCQSWQEATKIIESVSLRHRLVLILDMALDRQGDAGVGIEKAADFRKDYRDAIIIALTSWAADVRRDPRADDIFDAIVDKQEPNTKDPEKLREILKGHIDRALNPSVDRAVVTANVVRKVDSLGMRLAEAAIGRDGLDELVAAETKGWTKREVRALTSGFSGAHLLQITGLRDQHKAQLVLKAANKQSILQDEAEAIKKYGDILNTFASRITSVEGGVRKLDRHGVFYCRQTSVPGGTLYDLVRNNPDDARKSFASLYKLLLSQYEEIPKVRKPKKPKTANLYFLFRPDQPYRIQDSCDRLLPASILLQHAGQWPKGMPTPKELFGAVLAITANWQRLAAQMEVPNEVLQHGDLHAGNVLIFRDQITFIDLSRLGLWPIGYDISRLATHARIHLPWKQDDQDFIMHDLEIWSQSKFANLSTSSSNDSEDICEWSAMGDAAYANFIESQNRPKRVALRRLYQFCCLSDLLKIFTYGTLSHFKRIWTAMAIWQLGQELGFVRQKKK